MKQIENLNRYVTALEGKLAARISDVTMASNQAAGLAAQHNEVSRNLSAAIQQVHKLRAEWNEWNGEEDKPQDQESQEGIFHDPAEQSASLVPSVDQDMNQSNIQDGGLRSLIVLKVVCLRDTLSHDSFAARKTAGGNDARNTQSRIEKGSGEAFLHS